MECDDDGVVAKILIEEGVAGVQVGTLIALMVEEGQDWKDVAIPAQQSQESSPAVSAPAPVSPAPSLTSQAPPSPTTTFPLPSQTGPAASLLLSQYGLDPSKISGSGPKGNLTKADVMKHIKENSLPTPSPPQVPLPAMAKPVTPPTNQAIPVTSTTLAYTDIELSSMRKVIAMRLTDSKQDAPHGYSSATANLTAVSKLRQEYIKSGHKVSVNDFVIKAVATALQYVPELNA